MFDPTNPLHQMTAADDMEASKIALDLKIGGLKYEITQLLKPLEGRSRGGAIIMALLELGIERHLRICQTEKSANQLALGVIQKVLRKRRASLQ